MNKVREAKKDVRKGNRQMFAKNSPVNRLVVVQWGWSDGGGAQGGGSGTSAKLS